MSRNSNDRWSLVDGEMMIPCIVLVDAVGKLQEFRAVNQLLILLAPAFAVHENAFSKGGH